MPKNLKRYYGKDELHFITCSCYRRLPLLGSARARNTFVEVLRKVRDKRGFALVGYVVMPEHFHLLITEPPVGTPSSVLQVLKQRVSLELRRVERNREPECGRHLDRSKDILPQFWHRRFYDLNVWSQKKKTEKLEYMHMNPVKRGLVTSPKDWAWSSYSFYESGDVGLIRIDPV
ncbi:MAG: REP-associated tyrosine transposase [Candidatus Acidiferrales bacterium]